MARRGENIYKRKDKRWEGRYKKGRKPDGTLLYGFVYGKSYNEVKMKLVEFKYKYINTPYDFIAFQGTVLDWSMYYMEELVKSGIKQSTLAHYNTMLQNHILPYFGPKKLIAITRADIQLFISYLMQKGLHAGSVHSIFGILNRMFRKAVIGRVLLASPCEEITLPKKDKPNIEILTPTEQKILEKAAMKEKHGIAVILALYTGMRIGEISALKWKDIDFIEGIIHISKTVQRISSSNSDRKTLVVFDEPKSANSNRLIPMPEKIKALLENLKLSSESEYVVACKSGFAEPRVIRYRFHKIINKSGIKYISFHALRHTFATRCMELHMDITTLSRILGHSSVKMTLDIYTDSILEQRILSMHMLDSLFDS